MPSKPDHYNRLKDAEVDSIMIYSDSGGAQNIQEMVKGFSIYEDIDGSFMVATLDLVDNIAFATKFPIIGQETVVIKYRTPGFGYPFTKLRFDVMKVGKRTKSKRGTSEYYQLSCISSDYLPFTTSRLNGSYKGTASKNIRRILRRNGYKGYRVDTSKYNSSWVIPSFTVHKTLEFLTRRCRSRRTNLTDYLLFETSSGWRSRSLSNMFSGPSTIEYTLSEPTSPFISAENYTLIEDFQVLSHYNRHKEMERGQHSGRIVTFDWTKKTQNHSTLGSNNIYLERERTKSNIEKSRTLPVKNRYDGRYDTRVFIRNQSSGLHDVDEKSLDHNIENNENERQNSVYCTRSVLDKINHPNDYRTHLLSGQMSTVGFNPMRVLLKVPGNSDLNVGDVVTLVIPSPEIPSKKSQDNKDKSLSGRYLITNLRQRVDMLSETQFVSYLELGRDTSPLDAPDINKFAGTDQFSLEALHNPETLGLRRT